MLTNHSVWVLRAVYKSELFEGVSGKRYFEENGGYIIAAYKSEEEAETELLSAKRRYAKINLDYRLSRDERINNVIIPRLEEVTLF